jgi:hypothetical protein
MCIRKIGYYMCVQLQNLRLNSMIATQLQKRADILFYACGTAKLEIFETEEKARRAEESRGAIQLTLRKERERMGIP